MISSAAVRFRTTDNLDHIWHLHRHSDFVKMIEEIGLPVLMRYTEFGFIDYDERLKKETFVDAVKAKSIARQCGQKFVPGKENPYDPKLYSEDLY